MTTWSIREVPVPTSLDAPDAWLLDGSVAAEKVANLERLAVDQPGARRIGTWNAEENAHMLAINVAIGFRAAGGSGEWQRAAGSPAR